ncbi:MAG: DNA adenine methylase [Candidatus Hermodarchaeia archaeon]
MKTLLRPPVKYHGGKYYLCRWIIEYLPDDFEHMIYVEPFGGAASVLLNKKPSVVEVYNDSEYSIYNLMRILREEGEEFVSRLKEVKYEKDQYLKFREVYRSDEFMKLDPLDQAVITYSVKRMSRGGLCGTFCWSSRIYGDGVPGEVHSWQSMLPKLPLITERLTFVEVRNFDWREIIDWYDSSRTIFYIDPPYLKSTRVFKKAYINEMSESDHESLAKTLNTVKAKVILSGYPSEFYDKHYGDWRCVEKGIANHSSHEKVKQKKTECLWLNF